MKKLLALLLAALLAATCALAETGEKPGLPAFAYAGEDAIEGAVCDYLLAHEAEGYAGGDVTIPSPLLLEVDDADDADVLAWGVFSVNSYALLNTTLFCVSGGSVPGLMHLKVENGTCAVTSFDAVGDGDDYAADVGRIFGAREGLAEKLAASDEEQKAARLRYVNDYMRWNNLPITQLQDFGWVPLQLPDAPATLEEEQIVHHTSPLGYSVDYDLRQFSFIEYGDGEEGFAGVEALEGIGVDVSRRAGERAGDVIASLTAEMAQPVQVPANLGGAEAVEVHDGARPAGVTDRVYVLAGNDGCLTVAVSNTCYAGEDAPVVAGADAALDALLATFRLN